MATKQKSAEKSPIIQEAGELRKKNQLTLPKSIADALGMKPGDRMLFVVEGDEPGEARLYRMPTSFAGVAPHAYGADTNSAEYVRAERGAWEE